VKAHIRHKGKYIGCLYFKLVPVAEATGGLNKDNPIQNKSTVKQLTGEGNYDILKRIVDKTRGLIEDESYLQMLGKLLPKEFKVTIEGNPSGFAVTSPESLVHDISLPDRRTF